MELEVGSKFLFIGVDRSQNTGKAVPILFIICDLCDLMAIPSVVPSQSPKHVTSTICPTRFLTMTMTIPSVRRSRVIGDYRGYRTLIAYYAVFDREGVTRHW